MIEKLKKIFLYLKDILFFLVVLFITILLFQNKTNKNNVIPYYINGDLDFRKKVNDILSRSNWRKKYIIYETRDKESAIITINLSDRDVMEEWNDDPQYYPSGKQIRFSITTQSTKIKPEIFIDKINWLNGVEESGLTKEQYQEYVINHEFGHGLGYDHQKCVGQSTPNKILKQNYNIKNNVLCPVMYQMTRGVPEGGIPNYQVLPEDYTERIPNRYVRY
jgi:hypothetical protein